MATTYWQSNSQLLGESYLTDLLPMLTTKLKGPGSNFPARRLHNSNSPWFVLSLSPSEFIRGLPRGFPSRRWPVIFSMC